MVELNIVNLVPQIGERDHLNNPSNREVGMGLIFHKKCSTNSEGLERAGTLLSTSNSWYKSLESELICKFPTTTFFVSRIQNVHIGVEAASTSDWHYSSCSHQTMPRACSKLVTPGQWCWCSCICSRQKSRGAGEILSTSHNQAPNFHIEKQLSSSQLEVKIPSTAESIVLGITPVWWRCHSKMNLLPRINVLNCIEPCFLPSEGRKERHLYPFIVMVHIFKCSDDFEETCQVILICTSAYMFALP